MLASTEVGFGNFRPGTKSDPWQQYTHLCIDSVLTKTVYYMIMHMRLNTTLN